MTTVAKACACGRCEACVAVALYQGGASTKEIEARAGINRRKLYEYLRARGVPSSRRDCTDLSGRRFGALTVIGLEGKDPYGQTRWRCVCACGGERVVTRYRLTGARWKVSACLACTEKRLGRAAA